MPQNSVRSLAADAEGFVWIATENGLARFDGQRFNVFDKSFVGTTSNRFYMLSPSMNPTRAGRPGQQKPGREIFDWAAERLKVAPADIVHIGDSYAADVEGAVNAGMRAIWFRGAREHTLGERVAACQDAAEVRAALAAWGIPFSAG